MCNLRTATARPGDNGNRKLTITQIRWAGRAPLRVESDETGVDETIGFYEEVKFMASSGDLVTITPAAGILLRVDIKTPEGKVHRTLHHCVVVTTRVIEAREFFQDDD